MRVLLALALVLSASVTAAAVAVDPHDDPLTPDQRAWLDAHGPIRVGVSYDGAPDGFLEDGIMKGFGPDLAELAALKIGVEVELVPIALQDVASALRSGDVDVTGIWAARGDLVEFGTRTAPAAWVPITFITVDHPEFVTHEDLQGAIGVLDGSVMESRLREEFPALEPVPYATTPEGVQMLLDGNVSALLAPLPAVGYELAHLGVDRGLPVGEPLSVEPTYYWARADDPIPGQILDAGIARISAEEMAIIHIKWTGFDLTDPSAKIVVPDPTPLYVATGIIVGLLIIGTIGVYRTQRQRRAIQALVGLANEVEAGRFPAAVATEHMPSGPATIGRAMNRMVPQLMLHKGFLQEQVRDRTEALGQKNAELQDFVHATSHDLRQPLRSVQGFLHLLRDDLGTDLPEDAQRDVEHATAATERMEKMLDGLLEFSRIETHAEPPHMVELGKVMDEVLVDLQALIQETGAKVDVGRLPAVQASERQMHMLFQNLVNNACKFHRAGVPPEVRVTGAVAGDSIFIEVADNGIGIPEKDQGRIFGIFQRLHTREEFEGYGVGLAICRRIIERHGGSITLSSKEGAGTTFHIRLPTPKPSQPTPSAAVEAVETTGSVTPG